LALEPTPEESGGLLTSLVGFGSYRPIVRKAIIPRRKAKINPLLLYDRNSVTSVSVQRDQLTITFVIEGRGPLTVWFHSLMQLNEAYTEWESRAK